MRLSLAVLVLAGIACQTAPTHTRSGGAQAAVEDLAGRSGAPESEISVVTEQDATFPDACLGCAGPGEMCAQVVTPGSRIVLLARGVTYEYRADRAGRVRLCDQSAGGPAPTPSTS